MRKISLLALCLLLIACDDSPQTTFNPSEGEGVEEIIQSYFNQREGHPTRNQTLGLAFEFYGSDSICQDSDFCLDLCLKIFQLEFDREDCSYLPVSLMEKFDKIYQVFITQNDQALQEIDPFDLKVFLSFSLEPAEALFSKFGSFSAKEFLKWFFYDWSIAKILKEEDRNYKLLEVLFSKVDVDLKDVLSEPIESERVFQEIALVRQNDFALSWTHGYFDKLCEGEEMKNECVLSYYCSVSPHLHSDTSDEINDFQELKNILKSYTKQQAPQLKEVCSQFCKTEGSHC